MPRPRDRLSAMGLLPRMEARPRKDGLVTYRYHPLGGKPIPLGTDRLAAIQQVLNLNKEGDHHGTLQWVWEQFTSDTEPSPRWARLAEGTKADYQLAWKQIAKTFGAMQARHITQSMVARYVHVERRGSPRRANIEKALLSGLFGHGILLDVCEHNPTKDVLPHITEARTEAPKAEVLAQFLKWLVLQTPQRQLMGLAAEYASLTGSRKVEFLPLTWSSIDLEASNLSTTRAKQRGKKRLQVIELFEISPKLRDLLERLRALRVDRECDFVFPTEDNTVYTARGFKTMWQRCVRAAIEAGVLNEADRFTFHDLRAYYTSEYVRQFGQLPNLHKNPQTTAQVYDRNTTVNRKSL